MKLSHLLHLPALFSIICCGFAASAEIPVAYYSAVNGKADSDLKNALSALLYDHTLVSSYNDLPTYFQKTDRRPGTDYWWDMYSDLDVDMFAYKFGTYMNREHAFPKSWWGGLTDTPAYTDLNHLYPGEAKANQAKSNYPLGTVSTATFDNGVTKVGYAVTGQGGGAAKVFEPADEYKGDFARTYFYMVTCYQGLKWDTRYMYMLQQNDYPTLKPWAVDLLLKWHRDDPVSQKEIDRNEQVYRFQNNRNPFIDYPDLAEYIWGDKMGTRFNAGTEGPTGDPVLITPVQGMSLDMPQVAVGSKTSAILYFKGKNLRGNLSVAITGTDKAAFSIPVKSIASSLVNTDAGYALQVEYNPAATGDHTAKLIVSDGGIDGSLGVQLIGHCLPVPTLSQLTALPASEITSSTYLANWEEPENETVDYYIITRTHYNSGNSSSEEIIAEATPWEIDGFDTSDSESYNVRSFRLGYESAPSNEIYVDHAGVDGIAADIPAGWAYTPGGIRVMAPATLTDVRIVDLSGRTVAAFPSVENNTEILLPLGTYILTAAQCHTPMRILVRP